MTVNQRIKVELEERGISQYQVAKVTKIGQSTISKWFKNPGKSRLSGVFLVPKWFDLI